MSPTYTLRRGNRYRYYISQAQLRGGEPGSRPRIGADEVEQLVVQELCRQQGRDDQITGAASGAWSADIRELVRTAVDRIVIRHDGIEIALKSNAIDHAGGFDGDTQNESPISVGETVGEAVSGSTKYWSEWQDLNLRPARPDHVNAGNVAPIEARYLQKRLDFRCKRSVSVVRLIRAFALNSDPAPAGETATVGLRW
jgi:hypothetical protein